MTRFNSFTDNELEMMEKAFCNEGLHLVFEIREERNERRRAAWLRMFVEPQEKEEEGDDYEEEPYDLDMGFDPFMGCYTDDC